MSQKSAIDSSRPIIAAGTQLNAIYEIDEPIATGGMGEVYRGHAIQTGDLVAIKLIRSDLNQADAAFALFRKEAAALHNLYHEAIVRYYVFTVDPVLKRPYLAMEFVDGQSLSEILRSRRLSCEAVHHLMVRIASGLAAAHAQGIVHRDISPDNIIIPAGDMARAKIIDFGIARSMRLDSAGTIIGSGFAGKYNYVSPEQLGLFGGEVTPRSDIYSLGLVLAEALRQKPLDMGANHAEVIEKRRKLPELRDLDQRMRPLIECMLQPDPKDRPPSMANVAAWPLAGKSPKGSANEPSTQTVLVPANSTSRPATLPAPGHERDKKPAFASAALIGTAIALAIAAAFGLYRFFAPHQSEISESKIETVASKADNLRRFVLNYPGGPCFYVRMLKVTDASAVLEGYGVTLAPFSRLASAFREAAGFDAEIGVHEVAPSQCPALDLLGEVRNAPFPAPKIALASTALKPGENLVGTIEGANGRHVSLFIVADDGTTRSFAATPISSSDAKVTFAIRPDPELANGKLQLLIALASQTPIAAIEKEDAMAADKLFPKIFSDAKSKDKSEDMSEDMSKDLGLSAGIRSFKLDK